MSDAGATAAEPVAVADGASASTAAEIVAELSEVFAFSRNRWQRFAAEVVPDVKSVNLMMLHTILRKGPITPTELSALLDLDKAAVSRHVARLRELGLVSSVPSAQDGRVQRLTVTEKAEHQLLTIRERWGRAYEERFADWDLAALESLRDGLHRFNAATRE